MTTATATATDWTPHFHTAPNGDWRVAVLLADDRISITDPSKYVSEATATLAALASKRAKPFMNYVAVRV